MNVLRTSIGGLAASSLFSTLLIDLGLYSC